MKTIGVRDLRQRASECLREVQEGQSLQVTAHGRPVAQLVPVRRAGRRRLLATRGRLRPATGHLLDLGRPLAPAPGVPPASQLLRRARAEER
jgi:prevent-host-death family protein